jgi:hypothetical protein
MRYLAVGIAVVALCLGAQADDGKAGDFLHRIDWQISAGIPLTGENEVPRSGQWRGTYALGIAGEIPSSNYVAYGIGGDYHSFALTPQSQNNGLLQHSSAWFADIMFNMKWYFTKRSATVRPYLVGGFGWMLGNIPPCSGYPGGGRPYYYYDSGRYSSFADRFGFGVAFRLHDSKVIFAEASYVNSVGRTMSESDLPYNDVKFYPIRIGYSFH